MSMRLPTRLDRYPAKMVSRLADTLIRLYAKKATSIFDPFCGSGAVLVAGARSGIATTGVDVNPVAGLLSKVKMTGFRTEEAMQLALNVVKAARTLRPRPVRWVGRQYWFTPGTLEKYERLRAAGVAVGLNDTPEGWAVLLALALSVRLCSRADQRSPKPFISRQAIENRKGRHFDPYKVIVKLLGELGQRYGRSCGQQAPRVFVGNVVSDAWIPKKVGTHSHVITSPPYINAQDYFRNFKLELYILEGLLPFEVTEVKGRFIGTERGKLLAGISEDEVLRQRERVPQLKRLAQSDPKAETVVQRYLHDMECAFSTIRQCIESRGTFVLVCGDNLIGGLRIPTWKVLNEMLIERGFTLFDQFADQIGDRMLAPKRCGHKGLIKEEMVSAFRLN